MSAGATRGRRRSLRLLAALAGAPGACAPVQVETVQAPADVQQVVLTVDSGSVTLLGAPLGARVRIDREARAFPSTRGFHEKQNGGVLTINARCGGAPGCRVDHVLRIPPHVAVVVQLRNGDVELGGLEGDVQVDVGLGKITGSGLRSGSVDVRTEGGGIDLIFAAAPRQVTANAAAGDVSLRVPAGRYRCDLDQAAAGELGVTCDPNASATISASTGVGKLRIRGTQR